MKKLLLAFIIYFFTIIVASAQQTNLDSLYSVWEDPTQADSIRVKALDTRISYGYLFTQPDSAIILAEELHIYAKKHNYPEAAALAFSLQGIANTIQGNLKLAIEHSEKGFAIQEELGDKKGCAASLGNIGLIYYNQGNLPQALDYLLKAQAIYEELADEKKIAICLSNIAFIYSDLGDITRALEYNESSLKIQEKIGNKKGIASSLSNIGNIYSKQDKNSLALQYYEKSLSMMEEIGDKGGIADNSINIGSEIGDQGDYPKAMEYYLKALSNYAEIGDKEKIGVSMEVIGLLYQKQSKNSLALSYCQKGLALAEEIGALALQKETCKCLYDSYKALGNSNKALEYYEQMIVVRDSMFNEENTKKLVQIDMQYEFDRKESAAKAEQEKKDAIALQELKRQKLVRNGFMGGFAVVLLFAGVFFVQRIKIGKEKQRSEELLLNILPAEVAEELKLKGETEAQLIEHVTVLFTDFKGFTAMSEKLSPKDLVNDLNICFSEFDKIMEEHDIEKIKTIGDAYMAAGGLPAPNKTHAYDVVKAAFKMRDFVEAGKAKKIEAGLPYFEIRIGIHTGPVVAGIVGVKKFQYDIWGDTVNTASRMESAGEVGKVNISQATYELLKDDPQFSFESRGKIEAKGKGQMEMWFVSLKKE